MVDGYTVVNTRDTGWSMDSAHLLRYSSPSSHPVYFFEIRYTYLPSTSQTTDSDCKKPHLDLQRTNKILRPKQHPLYEIFVNLHTVDWHFQLEFTVLPKTIA